MDVLNAQRAVILACWPGTDPLLAGFGTDPALIDVAGKPMVQRVVEQAVALGARHLDVVLGDNAAPYKACLGNGERWGCTLAYHYAPAEGGLPRPLARQIASEADCLLLMANAMLPWGHNPDPASSGRRSANGEAAWSGWARLPGRTLVEAAAHATSPLAVARALIADPGVQSRHLADSPSAESAAALLATARALLRSPDCPIGVARRPAADGLWIGNGVRIHSTARVIAPAYLGENVLVGADAVVGPDAVVGAWSIVDCDATVADSLVAPGSYVGRGVELRQAILSGRRLVNVAVGAQLDLADRELAGSTVADEGPVGPGLSERLLASVLWTASWPLRRILARATVAPAGGTGEGDVGGDAVAAILRGDPGAWLRHFRDVLHPGFAEVIRGRRRIVGPLPAPAEATPLAAIWPARQAAGRGLVNDTLFLGPEGADPNLRFAADALAARKLHFGHIAGAVLRYARAVATDWRSSRAPTARAKPDDRARPPAQPTPHLARNL